jgi:hypothetical protein
MLSAPTAPTSRGRWWDEARKPMVPGGAGGALKLLRTGAIIPAREALAIELAERASASRRGTERNT